MLPGLPKIERADSEEGWNDFSSSQSGKLSHQIVNDSLQQETAFIISSPGVSPSTLFEASDHENDTCCDIPLLRLLKMVDMMSPKALSASVSDIGSTVCMTDRIASSAPLNKSKAAVGEDLVGTIASCLRKRCSRFGGTIGSRKTEQCRSARMYNSRQLMDRENFDLNSTSTGTKRPRIETMPVKHALLEEIRKINERLIDTVVSICDKDTMTTETETAAPIEGEGIIVKCSFVAMAITPNLITRQASSPGFAVHPLKLLVPKSYPRCSPIFRKLHAETCPDYEDLSFKAMEKFNMSVRSLPHPFSISEIAKTWDLCARAVVSEYAEQHGGGSFSTKYGTWEDCLHAAW